MLSQRRERSSPHCRICADRRRGAVDSAVRARLGLAGVGRRSVDSAGIAADPEIGGKKYVHARDLRESTAGIERHPAVAGEK